MQYGSPARRSASHGAMAGSGGTAQSPEEVSTAERLIMVSADAHTIAPPETFRPYIEDRYASYYEQLLEENAEFTEMARQICTFPEEVLAVIDSEGALRSGGDSGAYDVARRLEEMDREGIAAELLIYGTQAAITPFFGHSNNVYPPEVRLAGVRAYHRWVADCIQEADGRLFAIADPGPCLDMEQATRDLRWAAENGFRSVSVPGIVPDPDLPPLTSPYFEPFWRACADCGMTLSVHAGHGKEQGTHLKFMRLMVDEQHRTQQELLAGISRGEKEGSFFAPDMTPRRIAWNLMLGGVFDRYPSLKLVLTEVRSDWIPGTLRVLDRRYEMGGTPLRKRPSEYWASNCWSGVSSIKLSEVRLRESIGIDHMMFGRDYPHPEGTWPNTWDWLRDALGHLSGGELRGLLGENAIRCYGLDRAALKRIAQRIGPTVGDILGDHEVPRALVDHFDRRAGYRRSFEEVDENLTEELFEQDLNLLNTSV
jgi:predicted TIM-barrel fold metal-dependent hydrolase